jgi:hypothetical protein
MKTTEIFKYQKKIKIKKQIFPPWTTTSNASPRFFLKPVGKYCAIIIIPRFLRA